MFSPSNSPFWVYFAGDGTAKIHRADCPNARDTARAKRPRDKSKDKNWSPFATYVLARDFAERIQTKKYDYLSFDCRQCNPGGN